MSKAAVCAAALLALLFIGPSAARRKNRRNAGDASADAGPVYIGEDVPTGRFPYLCSLGSESRESTCGGVLLTAEWVLTAAHCLDEDAPGSVGSAPHVRCGVDDLSGETSEPFKTVAVFTHGSWTGNVVDGHDIAVLKLDRKANITLPSFARSDTERTDGEALVTLGRGRYEDGEQRTQLQMATALKTESDRQCSQRLDDVENGTLCVVSTLEETCQGDAGSPLIVASGADGNVDTGDPASDVVVGLLSSGPPKCKLGQAAVYTSVGHFWNWVFLAIGEALPPRAQVVMALFLVADSWPLSQVEEKRYARNRKRVAVLRKKLENSNKTVLLEEMASAILSDDVAVVEALLLEGLDPKAIYDDGKLFVFPLSEGSTWLHWAAAYGATESTKIMINYDVSVDHHDVEERLPLHIAAIAGARPVAQVLLRVGTMIEERDNRGQTPLYLAASYGHYKTAELLIEAGANVDATSSSGWTPLHAVSKNDGTRTAKLLVETGANLNAVDAENKTPLYLALERRNPDLAEVLISGGAGLDVATTEGWTALHLALARGEQHIAKLLIHGGANIDVANNDGWTPLIFSLTYSDVEVAELLVQQGGNVNAKDDEDWTALHYAALYTPDATQMLVDGGADVSAVNIFGSSALHFAASAGNVDAVEVLLDAGSPPDLESDDGKTPKDVVCSAAQAKCSRATRRKLEALLSS